MKNVKYLTQNEINLINHDIVTDKIPNGKYVLRGYHEKFKYPPPSVKIPKSFTIEKDVIDEKTGKIRDVYYELCDRIRYNYAIDILTMGGIKKLYLTFCAHYDSVPIIEKTKLHELFYFDSTFQVQVFVEETKQKFAILSNDIQGNFMKRPEFCFDTNNTHGNSNKKFIRVRKCKLCRWEKVDNRVNYAHHIHLPLYENGCYCMFCSKGTFFCGNEQCKNSGHVQHFYQVPDEFKHVKKLRNPLFIPGRSRVCHACSLIKLQFLTEKNTMLCSSKTFRKFCKKKINDEQSNYVNSMQTFQEYICNDSGVPMLDKILMFVVFNLMENLQFVFNIENEEEKNQIQISNEELIENFKEEIEINIGNKLPGILMKIRKLVFFLMNNFGIQYQIKFKESIKDKVNINYLSQVDSLKFKKRLVVFDQDVGKKITVQEIFD